VIVVLVATALTRAVIEEYKLLRRIAAFAPGGFVPEILLVFFLCHLSSPVAPDAIDIVSLVWFVFKGIFDRQVLLAASFAD